MTKPPFVIPTIKGHELWPTITRTPAVVRIQINPAPGMTPEEITAARLKAVKMIANAGGTIKQSYLAFRQGCDLSNLSFTSRVFPLAIGIVGRYVQNGSQEALNIVVNVSELIEAGVVPVPDEKKAGAFVVVVTEWEPGGFDGDPSGPAEGATFNYQANYIKVIEPKKYAAAIFASGAYIPADLPIWPVYVGATQFTGITTAIYQPKLFFDAGASQTVFDIVATWEACFNDNKNVTTTVMTFLNPAGGYIPDSVPFSTDPAHPNRLDETTQILQQAGYLLAYKAQIRKNIPGFMYISGYTDDLLHRPIFSVNTDFYRVATVTLTQADGKIITSVEPRDGTVSQSYLESGIGAV